MLLIKEISDNEEKARITDFILRQLPEWFGIEKAIVEYTYGSKNTAFYAAYEGDKVIGFTSIKIHNKFTAEIYIIGNIKEFQGRGIGRKMLKTVEEILIEKGYRFLTVKTLGESHPDEHYKMTREFYKKAGFLPLEESNEIWGPENPCLLMLKVLR